jgi:hypothetical protein
VKWGNVPLPVAATARVAFCSGILDLAPYWDKRDWGRTPRRGGARQHNVLLTTSSQERAFRFDTHENRVASKAKNILTVTVRRLNTAYFRKNTQTVVILHSTNTKKGMFPKQTPLIRTFCMENSQEFGYNISVVYD